MAWRCASVLATLGAEGAAFDRSTKGSAGRSQGKGQKYEILLENSGEEGSSRQPGPTRGFTSTNKRYTRLTGAAAHRAMPGQERCPPRRAPRLLVQDLHTLRDVRFLSATRPKPGATHRKIKTIHNSSPRIQTIAAGLYLPLSADDAPPPAGAEPSRSRGLRQKPGGFPRAWAPARGKGRKH